MIKIVLLPLLMFFNNVDSHEPLLAYDSNKYDYDFYLMNTSNFEVELTPIEEGWRGPWIAYKNGRNISHFQWCTANRFWFCDYPETGKECEYNIFIANYLRLSVSSQDGGPIPEGIDVTYIGYDHIESANAKIGYEYHFGLSVRFEISKLPKKPIGLVQSALFKNSRADLYICLKNQGKNVITRLQNISCKDVGQQTKDPSTHTEKKDEMTFLNWKEIISGTIIGTISGLILLAISAFCCYKKYRSSSNIIVINDRVPVGNTCQTNI